MRVNSHYDWDSHSLEELANHLRMAGTDKNKQDAVTVVVSKQISEAVLCQLIKDAKAVLPRFFEGKEEGVSFGCRVEVAVTVTADV